MDAIIVLTVLMLGRGPLFKMFHVLACFILTVGFMAFENGYKVAKEEHCCNS